MIVDPTDEIGNVEAPPEYGIDITVHGGIIKYGPWAGLKAGDIYPLYNPLSLNGTRVRGAEAMLNLTTSEKTWGTLRVVRGESRREIPAYIVKYDTGNGTRIDTVSGSYAQVLTAARLGIGGGLERQQILGPHPSRDQAAGQSE